MSAPPPKFNARSPHLSSRVSTALDRWQVGRGRWVIYFRSDKRFPCSCFDPTTGGASDEGDPDCSLCFGRGYKTTPERLRCYIGVPENLSTLVTPTSIGSWGRLDQYPGVAYIPRGVYPNKLDLLAECTWSVPNKSVGAYGTPTELIRLWKIPAVIPVQFNEESQSEFFLAGLEHHDLKREFMEGLLKVAGTKIQPPNREGLLAMQTIAESFTPLGGNTGSRDQQRDAPGSSYQAARGLGRAGRINLPGL